MPSYSDLCRSGRKMPLAAHVVVLAILHDCCTALVRTTDDTADADLPPPAAVTYCFVVKSYPKSADVILILSLLVSRRPDDTHIQIVFDIMHCHTTGTKLWHSLLMTAAVNHVNLLLPPTAVSRSGMLPPLKCRVLTGTDQNSFYLCEKKRSWFRRFLCATYDSTWPCHLISIFWSFRVLLRLLLFLFHS